MDVFLKFGMFCVLQLLSDSGTIYFHRNVYKIKPYLSGYVDVQQNCA